MKLAGINKNSEEDKNKLMRILKETYFLMQPALAEAGGIATIIKEDIKVFRLVPDSGTEAYIKMSGRSYDEYETRLSCKIGISNLILHLKSILK